MPPTHNEDHYRTDVVRLWRLERHKQPYRSERSKEERKEQGRGKSQGDITGSR